LEVFGGRPPEYAAPHFMQPASETLHKSCRSGTFGPNRGAAWQWWSSLKALQPFCASAFAPAGSDGYHQSQKSAGDRHCKCFRSRLDQQSCASACEEVTLSTSASWACRSTVSYVPCPRKPLSDPEEQPEVFVIEDVPLRRQCRSVQSSLALLKPAV